MMFIALIRCLSCVAKRLANLAGARLSCQQMAGLLMVGLVITGTAQGQINSSANGAQSNWWFDIEVIVFKHTVDASQLVEQFDNAIVPIDLKNSHNLILEHLRPNTQQLQRSLEKCYLQPNSTITLPLQTAPAFEIDETLFQPVTPDPVESLAEDERNELTYNPVDGYRVLSSENAEASEALAFSPGPNTQNEPPATPTEQELQAMQMAFSMPEQVPQNVDNIPNDSSNNRQQQADAPPNALQQETTAAALTATPNAHLPQHAPMLLQSENHKAGLQELHVPQNPGCQFATEMPDVHQQAFEQWLAELLPPVHNLEAKLTAQLAQYQQQTQVNGLTGEATSEQTRAQANSPATGANALSLAHLKTDAQAATANSEPDYPDSLPLRYNALLRHDTQSAYLLPNSELTMRNMSRNIHRRSGISVMSHFAWRQLVPFGRENAPNFRIIAGKNYSKEFGYEGYPLVSPGSAFSQLPPPGATYFASPDLSIGEQGRAADSDLMHSIHSALAALDSPSITGKAANHEYQLQPAILQVPMVPPELTPEQVWELDGVFKVYLQYIGRVPYLHIDSRLNFRQPMLMNELQFPEPLQSLLNENTQQSLTPDTHTTTQPPRYFLKPYHFQQLRRVVSRQIHYFDHPVFGMLVQIRRYQIPDLTRQVRNR